MAGKAEFGEIHLRIERPQPWRCGEEPVIAARGKALEALSWIRLLQAVDPYPDPVSLMGKVAALREGQQVTVSYEDLKEKGYVLTDIK